MCELQDPRLFQRLFFFNATSNAEIVFPKSSNRNTTENLKEIVKYEKISDDKINPTGKSQQ